MVLCHSTRSECIGALHLRLRALGSARVARQLERARDVGNKTLTGANADRPDRVGACFCLRFQSFEGKGG